MFTNKYIFSVKVTFQGLSKSPIDSLESQSNLDAG